MAYKLEQKILNLYLQTVKYRYLFILFYIVLMIVSFYFASDDIAYEKFIIAILVGNIFLGAITFLYAYFIYSKKGLISYQLMNVDVFTTLLAIGFVVMSIISSGKTNLYGVFVCIIPSVSIAIKQANAFNKKLMSNLDVDKK